MINILSKVATEEPYFNIVKVIYEKPRAIILSRQNLKAFPLISGTRQGCLLLPFLSNIVLEVLGTTIRQEDIQIGKEEEKLSLFADDMIVYIENLKDSTKKLLDLINECSKVAGYKINIQKFVTFLFYFNLHPIIY